MNVQRHYALTVKLRVKVPPILIIMYKDITVRGNDYKFLCLIRLLMSKRGINCSAFFGYFSVRIIRIYVAQNLYPVPRLHKM